MKRTLAQSLTFYSKISPESKAGESRNILEKVERKPERQHERGQHNHACNYPVDFSDRHWNQDLKRKKERDGDRKRHYCTVLCSATIIASTGSSMLWLVLHILAQKGAQTHTHAHAPGTHNPYSIIHVPLQGHFHPHLNGCTQTLPHTLILWFVIALLSSIIYSREKAIRVEDSQNEGKLNTKERNANLLSKTDGWREIGEKQNPKRIYFNQIEIVFSHVQKEHSLSWMWYSLRFLLNSGALSHFAPCVIKGNGFQSCLTASPDCGRTISHNLNSIFWVACLPQWFRSLCNLFPDLSLM